MENPSLLGNSFLGFWMNLSSLLPRDLLHRNLKRMKRKNRKKNSLLYLKGKEIWN